MGIVGASAIATCSGTAIAQITPDASLGSEPSVIHRNVPVRGERGDRIEGGAIRGSHLFHSFSDFNVNLRQRVYFSPPAAIDTIISRVTGQTRSRIDGTLGVLGQADLFLINPNGIVFGPHAVLDIGGSLVASTADRVVFETGEVFRATAPNAPPLLQVNAAVAGLESWLPRSGTLQTQGQLTVGGDLTLAANRLEVQGTVSAGQDLSLIARDRLTATDQPTRPLRLVAGGRLWLQGDRTLTLAALSHPDSLLTAGGQLLLRSNAAIGADARFTAAGPIRVERGNGDLGQLTSLGDPVFQTAGDFAANGYRGASLQILAGGRVTIPGEIVITGAGGPFNNSTVTLSDGTLLSLNGTTEPTVDIRAGTTRFFGAPVSGGTPTRADITIGRIVNPTGTVYLTNRLPARSPLTGDITVGDISTVDGSGGGDIVIDAQGGITFRSLDASGGDVGAFLGGDFNALGGDGGAIKLLAGGDIVMPLQSFLSSYGLRGGPLTLTSDTAIIQASGPPGAGFSDLSFIESISSGAGRGGDMVLSAPTLFIGGNLFVDTYGEARSGNLVITGGSLVTDQASLNTDTFGAGNAGTVRVTVDRLTVGPRTLLGSVATSDQGGNGGDVVVRARSITAREGGQIGSLVTDLLGTGAVRGNAGDVTVIAQDITLSGFQLSSDTFSGSAIISNVGDAVVAGNAGRVTIVTDTLALRDGASINTSSFTNGNAGAITITARERIQVDGAVVADFTDPAVRDRSEPSAISSELFTGAVGQGGSITLRTPILELTQGGTITTLSDGDGPAGSIRITATDSIRVDGGVVFPQAGVEDRFSRIAVITESASTGNAGQLRVQSPRITLANGGQLSAESRGSGAGGTLIVQGQTLFLENRGLISAETRSNTGGNMTLRLQEAIALTGGSRLSATAGTAQSGGDGGNIAIETQFLVADPNGNNDITANAFEGAGGRVDITADGIFGLVPRSRADLEAQLGTSDPAQLAPANLPSSDITAISQTNANLNGEVIIRSPDVDPNQDIADLPSTVVDASRLIAQGCTARGTTLAQAVGSLIVTGRGGLPQHPGESLVNPDLLLGWDGLEGEATGETAIAPSSAPSPPLVEVQSLTRRQDGRVLLTAQVPSGPPRLGQGGETCVSPLP